GLPFKDGREMVEYHWQRRDQPLSEPSTPPTNVCAVLTKQLCCRVAKGFRYGWKSPEGSRYVHWRHGSDPPREEYVRGTSLPEPWPSLQTPDLGSSNRPFP